MQEPVEGCPRGIKTTLQKIFSCPILLKYIWDNIAQENYLCNVCPEGTEIDLQENNLCNVVLHLTRPTLHKIVICAMLGLSPQSSQCCLNTSETMLYRTNCLGNVDPEHTESLHKKIIFSFVWIYLHQHWTRKLPVECCAMADRQSLWGK